MIFNPQCACAARVTVIGLCVCLLPRFLPLGATRQPISYANRFGATLASLFL